MKKLVLLSGFLLAVFFANAQAVQDWTSGLPPLGNGTNSHSIATDSQGNVYSVGNYDGVIRDFDAGSGVFTMSSIAQNMYILKVNALGNFVWAKQIGGSGSISFSSADALYIDGSNNLYISGSCYNVSGPVDFDPGAGVHNVSNPSGNNMYLLKLDFNGDYIWDKQFLDPLNSGAFDKIQAIKVDASGNIYATGGFGGTLDFDPGAGTYNLSTGSTSGTNGTEIFILKLDASGNFTWAKMLKSNTLSTNLNYGYSIDTDASGNVYTTGYYAYAMDADPGTGVFTLNIDPTTNGIQYVSKLDTNGNYVWAYDIKGQHNVNVKPSLALDNASNMIITSYPYNSNATFMDLDFGTGTYFLPADTGALVFKINTNAGFIWAKSTARTISAGTASSQNYGTGLTLDSAGNIYTTGYFGNNGPTDFDPSAAIFTLSSTGSYDGYVSKLDTNGNFIWANRIGGTGLEYCYAVVASPLGKVTVSGSTNAGFTKSVAAVTTGGFLASFTQPALATTQFELDKNIAVYPNPTSGEFNIKINDDLVGAKVSIYNIVGQKIKDFSLDVLTTTQNLNSGMYLLEIEKDGSKTTRKLIVN